jgi:hypothetical protein
MSAFGENTDIAPQAAKRRHAASKKAPARFGRRRGQFGLEKARTGAEGAGDQRDCAKLNLVLWPTFAEAVQTAWHVRDADATKRRPIRRP